MPTISTATAARSCLLSRELQTTLRDSMRTDTIRIDSIVRRDTLHRDSLVTYPFTYYFPRDIALRYSVAKVQQYGLERHSRPDSLICRLEFLAEPKKLPRLRSLDKPTAPSESLYWATAKGKVVDLWLRDKELLARDSVRFALTYEKTDSLLRLQEKTDTLVFIKPQARAKKHDKAAETEKSPLQITLTGASGTFAGTPSDSLYVTASRPPCSPPLLSDSPGGTGGLTLQASGLHYRTGLTGSPTLYAPLPTGLWQELSGAH